MSKNQFGETSWDAVELKNNNAQRSKDLYMRLSDGSNVIRTVTQPYEYSVHVFKEDGDAGFGDKVMCSQFHKSCTLCAQGDRAKRRWLVGVIDRKTQSYKILDISVSVFKAIQELARDEDYGDPKRYDIDIKVDKQGGATGYYTVIPKPPKPLSAADVELMETVDTDELLRKVTPPTPEKMQERLDAIRERKAGKGQPQGKSASHGGNTKASKAAVDMTSSDESDYVFPSV
jgi:hypothetical protein